MSEEKNNFPKGTSNNPYTKEEFDEMCRKGTWTGGYVEGYYGYIEPETIINGSSEDDSWSMDSWAEEFQNLPDIYEEDSNSNDNNNDFNEGYNNYQNDGNNYQNTEGSNNYNVCNDTSNRPNSKWTSLRDSDKQKVNEAAKLSSKVKAKLNSLISTGSIVHTDDNSVQEAQWIWGDNIMVLGQNVRTENIWHELVHSFQSLGSHSNMEFQAYMLDFIWAAMSCCGGGESNSTGLSKYELEKYDKLIWKECDYESGKVGQALVDYLNNLDYEKVVNDFINYHKELKKSPSAYTEPYDPHYNWNWEGIIENMGFIIK